MGLRDPNMPKSPDRRVVDVATGRDDACGCERRRDDEPRDDLLEDREERREERLGLYSTKCTASSWERSVGSSSACGKSKNPIYPGIPKPCESLTITVMFSSFSTCQRRILERKEWLVIKSLKRKGRRDMGQVSLPLASHLKMASRS